MKNFFKIFALFVGINFSLVLPSLGGMDDLSTPGINEGMIGSQMDDLSTPGINEGMIGNW